MASGRERSTPIEIDWARIEALYERAMAVVPDDRRAFVQSEAAGDASLAAQVLAMLEADASPLGIERMVRDDGEAQDPRLGATIGAWRIGAVLGRGGGGVVYLVDRADGQYDQRAALKLMSGVLAPGAIARFHRERQILARLVHPNIARLIDGGVTLDGAPYLVIEYVDGGALTTHCDDRRLSIEDRLRLFTVACGAVDHAHRALVVHRDLKPSNIFVSRHGEVKLLDFGIAKILEPDAPLEAQLTLTEHRALTPAYAAPEQLRHEAVTTATDVYSLGVVLYELLSGRRPHAIEGLSPADAERVVTGVDPTLPSAIARQATPAIADARSAAPARLASRLRGDLDRVCLKALDREPDRRYPSPRQLADDIERFLAGHPVAARPATPAYRAKRFVARHRVGVGAAAAFLLLVTTFAAVAAIQARVVAAERDRVRDERNKAREVVRLLVDLFQTSNPEVVPDGDRLPVGVFLQNAEARVVESLKSQPDVQATLDHVLGQMHFARSDYARARALLERSFADLKRLHGPDDPETIEAQIDLGRLLVEMDASAGARPVLEDARDRALRTLGAAHALTARAYYGLASAFDAPEQAQPLYERALEIRRTALPPDDPDIALTLGALAVQEMSRERYDRSRARFDEATAVANRFRGGRHVAAQVIANDYAALLSRLGEFAEAEAMYRRSLQLATELIGPQSAQVANTLNNVATVLASEGRLEEAVDLCRDANGRFVALVGESDSRSANTARNVAIMYLWLDRPQEGRPWIDRAVRASEAVAGPGARVTVYMRAQQATIRQAAGDTAGALLALRAARTQIASLVTTKGQYMLADVQLYLGRALFEAGRPAEAESEFRQALDYRRRMAGRPQVAVAECDLARALAARGEAREARALLTSCVPALENYALMPRSIKADVKRLRDRLR